MFVHTQIGLKCGLGSQKIVPPAFKMVAPFHHVLSLGQANCTLLIGLTVLMSTIAANNLNK